MVVPPAPDGADALTGSQETESTHDSTQAAAPGRFSRGGWRLPVLVVLAVAVLAAGVVFALLLSARFGGDAEAEQQRRDEIMAQSEQFMLRMGTFGPDMLSDGQMPEYREQVTEVITPKFSESFEQQVSVAEQLVAQSELERSAEVFSTGVTSADKDSAQALVAGSFTDAYGGDQGRPYPFRIRLELVKVEGEWLVDDFAPVSDGGGNTGVPGEQPDDQPGELPTEQPGGGQGGSGNSGSGGSGGGQ